jgi:hypothetical protein
MLTKLQLAESSRFACGLCMFNSAEQLFFQTILQNPGETVHTPQAKAVDKSDQTDRID